MAASGVRHGERPTHTIGLVVRVRSIELVRPRLLLAFALRLVLDLARAVRILAVGLVREVL